MRSRTKLSVSSAIFWSSTAHAHTHKVSRLGFEDNTSIHFERDALSTVDTIAGSRMSPHSFAKSSCDSHSAVTVVVACTVAGSGTLSMTEMSPTDENGPSDAIGSWLSTCDRNLCVCITISWSIKSVTSEVVKQGTERTASKLHIASDSSPLYLCDGLLERMCLGRRCILSSHGRAALALHDDEHGAQELVFFRNASPCLKDFAPNAASKVLETKRLDPLVPLDAIGGSCDCLDHIA